MGVSKVVYGNNTLVDLTNDSVSESTLAKGVTAHDAAGNQVTGTMETGTSVTAETITEALGYTPTKAWYVTFILNDDDTLTADKTLSEIYQAYQDGYAVYGYIDSTVYQPVSIASDEAVFFYTVSDVNVIQNCMIWWDSDGLRYELNTIVGVTDTANKIFIVNIESIKEEISDTMISVTVDKTISEIYNASENGQIVLAKNNGMHLLLTSCTSNSATFTISSMNRDGTEKYMIGLFYKNGDWIYVAYAFPDETTLVNKVLAALPTWSGGSY